jgi:hypothetical protein
VGPALVAVPSASRAAVCRQWAALPIFLLFFISLPGGLDAAESLRVSGLRCESTTDPLGVDVAQPRLSWRVTSDENGQRQTAWQLLVASSREALAAGRGDLWDSGRVNGDVTLRIPYAGRILVSSQQVFWKVRAWDRDGFPSDWSQPATWTMGLLSPDAWQARWLTTAEREENLLLRREFTVKPDLRLCVKGDRVFPGGYSPWARLTSPGKRCSCHQSVFAGPAGQGGVVGKDPTHTR